MNKYIKQLGGLCALAVGLCVLAVSARATNFIATNDLAETIPFALYTNSAGQFIFTGLIPVTNGSPQTITYTIGQQSGVAVVNTSLGAARTLVWASFSPAYLTNGCTASYMATNGALTYYSAISGAVLGTNAFYTPTNVSPFATNRPGTIINTNIWTNSTH